MCVRSSSFKLLPRFRVATKYFRVVPPLRPFDRRSHQLTAVLLTTCTEQTVKKDGLNIWSLPESGRSPEVDIIAVQGLGSHPFYTWARRVQINEPSKHQGRLHQLFSRKRKDGTGEPNSDAVMWPRDLLPAAFKNARIATYSYQSDWRDHDIRTSLRQCSEQFLNVLLHNRHRAEERERPLILIGHSLGGLVIQQALVIAVHDEAFTDIRLSVAGIIFLGAPFQGSKLATYGKWIAQATRRVTTLLRSLEKDNPTLHSLSRDFWASYGAWDIVCFYENKDKEYGPWRLRVVNTQSASLHGKRMIYMNTDHSGLNKFTGADDENYKLLLPEIQRMVENGSPLVADRHRRKGAACIAATHGRWLVPLGRNQDFVGRQHILAKLLEKIPPAANKDDCQRTILEGLGGVGKTQIALEAVFRLRDRDQYCSVFWVPAVDNATFEAAYREIGRKLQIHAIEDDDADVKALVKAALSDDRTGNWLLVVDNADDQTLLSNEPKAAYNADDCTMPLERHLPWSPKGSILFTTRNHNIAINLDIPRSNIVTVEEMTSSEALDLLKTTMAEEVAKDMQSSRTLLDLLVNLPLAIKQASAYMAKNGMSTTRYLEIYQESDQDQIDLLHEDFKDRHRYKNIKNPVATTWLISFRHITEIDPLAADYLKLMSLMVGKDIPLSLLPLVSKKQTSEAIGTLKAYAFLTERDDGNSYDIHRLVQIAARNWLKANGEWQEMVTKALRRLAELFPFPKHENRQVWIRYLPHAHHILQFRKDVASNKETGRALPDLLYNVGLGFYVLGKYAEAEPMYREAWQLLEKVLGREHPDTLRSINNLASMLNSQGKYAAAEEMHRRAWKLFEKVLGYEHPDTLQSMNNLALVLNSQGKHDEAEKMHRRALKLQETVLGCDHPDTLQSMNNLAEVLKSQGRHAEAEAMHRKALKLFETVLGCKHPLTLASMNNLANVLQSQGKYGHAEAIYHEALKLQETVLGCDHPDTLQSMNNLAAVLHSQGNYAKAETMHRKALELLEKVFSCDHPSTLQSMNNLANVLYSQGKYAEAETMHRKALELLEKVFSRDHPSTLQSVDNLALVLNSQGKHDEAEKMYREVLEGYEKVLSRDHPSRLQSMNNLALVLDSQDKHDEAEKMYRETLQLYEKVLGRDHPGALSSMTNLAGVLYSQGKHDEAETMYRETLQLYEKVLGRDHPNTLSSKNNLAIVLDSQGKHDEAEAMHRETLQLREKVLGRDHPSTVASVNNLASVLESQGKHAEAEQVRKMRKKVE